MANGSEAAESQMLHRAGMQSAEGLPVVAAGFSRLVAVGLGWLSGVAIHLHQPVLLPAWVAVTCLSGGVLACVLARRWRRRWMLLLAAGLLLGAGASGWRASMRLVDTLPDALVDEDLVLTGVVAGLPRRSASGQRFLFEVAYAEQDGRRVQVPKLVSLGWYAGSHRGSTSDGAPDGQQSDLRAGQAWRFTARLRQPHGNLNPHGFDYELYLFEQGVRATGSVRHAAASSPVLIDAEAAFPIERWRQRVRDAIEAEVADRRAAGVMAALAVGDQSAIDHDDWQVFRDTGVAHLMSISGLHVTMFAWLAGAVLRWLWGRSRRALLWVPAPSAAAVGGLLAAAGYALFSGWGVPAQRTVWMLGTVTLLRLLGRRWTWPAVLSAAAVVVSAFDPWALLQAGFWLSFAAVGVLTASGPALAPGGAGDLAQAPRSIARSGWLALLAGVRTQVVATVGLAPLTLVFFQQLSLLGFVANMAAIPLVTLLLTPLALLGTLWAPLWLAGAWIERHFAWGLQQMSVLPWAVWPVAAAPWWVQAAGLLAAVLAVMPLPWRLRILALPLVMPLVWPPVDRPAEGRFDVLAVDVGQGSSVLVRTREHLLVYDTGPRHSADSDAGERVLLPLLRARGETRIDLLVLSHRDADHVGGAESLLRKIPVAGMSSTLEAGHALLSLAPNATRCEAGRAWEWDGVSFEMIHPFSGDDTSMRKPGGRSCVLRVSGAQGSLLLAGDIERGQEARLVAVGAPLRSDVLLVPRHGSATSSSAGFLDAVKPQVAVVQAGYRNRFGHPAVEVRERLEARHVVVRESPSCGAWHWSGAAASAPEGICERDRAARYWHHAP